MKDSGMARHRMLKSIHLASTLWFILCIAYIFILVLRQAGVHWWIIFSLSGHSALLIFLLVSLYLFAIFRGVSRSQKIEVEHPLSSTNYYKVLYAAAPFLGGFAGYVGMIGEKKISQLILGISLGTLGTTFLVWVIVDPAVGLLEMLLPASSRKHRAQRLAQAKAQREKKQKDRQRLLTEIFEKEELNRRRWQEILKPHAEKLAGLLTADKIDFKQAEREAIDTGVNAWQIGGLSCMRELRNMAMTISKEKSQDKAVTDYISVWWDGIGSWRNPSMMKQHLSNNITKP